MNKFKLKHQFSQDNKTVKSFKAETLDDVLFHMTDFLRGVGYVFDGELQVVDSAETIEQIIKKFDDQMEFDFNKR